MVMVDLDESKSSHKFMAFSCPFQPCCRRQHVKMSKWFSHFGDDHHEVNETEQQRRPSRRWRSYRNICKAIAFRFWNNLQKVSLLSICGISRKRVENISYVFGYLVKLRWVNQSIWSLLRSINQSILKQGTGGGHIFPKKKKKNLLCKWKDHLGMQIRRNEQVLRCQGR